jgi:hypothetical protein
MPQSISLPAALLALSLPVLSLPACCKKGKNDKPVATTDSARGCSKDNDCKGSRVCVASQCVDPKPTTTATPVTTVAQRPPPTCPSPRAASTPTSAGGAASIATSPVGSLRPRARWAPRGDSSAGLQAAIARRVGRGPPGNHRPPLDPPQLPDLDAPGVAQGQLQGVWLAGSDQHDPHFPKRPASLPPQHTAGPRGAGSAGGPGPTVPGPVYLPDRAGARFFRPDRLLAQRRPQTHHRLHQPALNGTVQEGCVRS